MPDGATKVYVLPDYRQDNPYQQLLVDALAVLGVESRFARGYKRIFPVLRGLKADFPEADVVHLHWADPFYKGDARAVRLFYGLKLLLDLLLVRWLARKRIVWTLHNYGRHDDSFPRLTLWLMRWWANAVHHMLILNESDRAAVRQRYHLPAEKVSVTLHGHYRSVYGEPVDNAAARAALHLPQEGRVFLFLGMLKPYKGLELLLDCWAQYAEQHPADLLLIAGESPDKDYGDELKGRIDRLNGQVRLDRQFVPDESIRLYYSAADLAVFPFEQISNSGSLLLAMSYCCPAIVPAFPVIEEAVGSTGALFYAPGDAAELLQKMRSVQRTELDRIRNQLKNEVARLDWSHIARQTLDVYDGR